MSRTEPRLGFHEVEEILKDELGRCQVSMAIALRGQWGVGKTYLVRKYLEGLECKGLWCSAFGAQSVDDLKAQLLPSILSHQKFTSSLKPIAEFFGRGDALASAQAAAFAFLEEELVIVDDVERASSDLNFEAILGFINYLVEVRHCKVIMILNPSQLRSNDREAWDRHREKVFDAEVELRPGPAEVLELVLSDELPAIRQAIEIAEVENIRLVQKVKAASEFFLSLLEDPGDEFKWQFLTNLVVLVLSRLDSNFPQGLPDSYEDILYSAFDSYDRYSTALGERSDDEAAIDRDKARRQYELLQEIGFRALKTDSYVSGWLRYRYLNHAAFLEAVAFESRSLRRAKVQEGFSKVDRLYCETFSDNSAEVRLQVERYLTEIREADALLRMNDLINVYRIAELVDLDCSSVISEQLALLVNATDPRILGDLLQASSTFPELESLVEEKRKKVRSGLSLGEVVTRIWENRSWGDEEGGFLERVSVDEVKDWLLSSGDHKLLPKVRFILSAQGLKFRERLREVLVDLSDRCPLTRDRVKNLLGEGWQAGGNGNQPPAVSGEEAGNNGTME